LLDFLEFLGRKAVLSDRLRRECRSQGSRHGRASIVAFWDVAGIGVSRVDFAWIPAPHATILAG
jgi:hypothetical protein